nr:MAG TPA: hypothetical protein [Caudoviricetes sp.]
MQVLEELSRICVKQNRNEQIQWISLRLYLYNHPSAGDKCGYVF